MHSTQDNTVRQMAGGIWTLAEHGLDFTSLARASEQAVWSRLCVPPSRRWQMSVPGGARSTVWPRKPAGLAYCLGGAPLYTVSKAQISVSSLLSLMVLRLITLCQWWRKFSDRLLK